MPKQRIEEQNLTFRRFNGEADFSIMHSILLASNKADQVIEAATVDDIKNWCAPSDRFDPRQNILFALEKGQDDDYTAWLKNPSHTPHLWQVAWDGDQVAGMVLVRISEAENRELDRKRGYTEHVFVRKPWRQRGLASALIALSLLTLKNQGMEEAELGVDSENESGAFRFYKGMGYQTVSTDIWFRKAMDVRSEAS